MPVKVKKVTFDYIAHVQREGGHVVELAGSREASSYTEIYDWLQARSLELQGFLISQSIKACDNDVPWKQIEVPALPAPQKTVRVETPSLFSDRAVFGVFTNVYKGATALTMKVTKE